MRACAGVPPCACVRAAVRSCFLDGVCECACVYMCL